jgi:benzylsuccinate CoA-transferase BbsF subunit
LTESALKGIKVADFSWLGAGPRATRILADNGATVVKVESSKKYDLIRAGSPFKDNIVGVDRSIFFAQTNTSKLGITLNLKHPKSNLVVERLVKWADVVLENYGTGVIDKMGLGYKKIKEIKPDIIMISISIAGRTGPFAKLKGYGHVSASYSGHATLTGWPDKPPISAKIAYGDHITPLFAVIAVLAAMEHKRKTGEGQFIDLCQLETMIQYISPAFIDYFANGNKQTRIGNRSPWASPHDAFPCQGIDQWCAIAVHNETHWHNLCTAMEKSDLEHDPRFENINCRKKNENELYEIISGWTRNYTKQQVMIKLQSAGVPAGSVQDERDLLNDPVLKGRLIREIDHPVIGTHMAWACSPNLSKTPSIMSHAPCLGEHNQYVYTKLLGLSDSEFVDMLNDGVFE